MVVQETDKDLARAFISGDSAAFNRLAMRYQDKIYWHARRMTGNHLDADDIVQEVFLVIYEKLQGFKFESALYTWIYRVTATRSLNLLRRRKIRRLLSIDDDENPVEIESQADPINDLDTKNKIEALDSVLQKLPLKQREVFILRNLEQLSYDEIANITGRKTGTLKANYFHAFEKVQKYMKALK
jgi:RNA polymerase sigma-70 factor (ECF subfamily)